MKTADAWRGIAESYREYYKTHRPDYTARLGLCRAASVQYYSKALITRPQVDSMWEQIDEEAAKRGEYGYLWKCTWRNAMRRARLAEKFARALERRR